MYKAILVDDEALIRDAIQETIQWEKLGFELTAVCQNGKEVVQILEKHPVDLVLTDICMPYMDGLELAKYINEKFPEIKVVIISGYDDFEYAKRAVKYQVQEYLLKPVTAAEFTEILNKIRQILDEQNKEQEYIHKMKHAYDENLPALKNRFLAGLVTSNSMPADYISDKLEEFQAQLDGPYYLCVVFHASLPGKGGKAEGLDSLSAFSVYSTIKDIIHALSAGEVFQDTDNQTVAYFSAKTSKEVFTVARSVCEEIHHMVTEILKLKLDIGIGKPVYTLHKLPLSYQNARTLMENVFFVGSNQILTFSDFSGQISDVTINRTEWTNKILEFIKNGNREELDFLLEQFIQTLRKGLLPKSKVILYIQSVVLSIMNFLDNTLFYSEELFEEEQRLFDRLPSLYHLSEMEQQLKEFCHYVVESIYSRHDSYNQKQAMLAMDFIEHHYQDSEITLNTICQHLSMSTSRFSTIFKNSTGETFVEALTRVRIEHAKELIEFSSMKAYEIAEQVGYTDPHYFSIAFKKYTGLTPTEYAKLKKGS